MMANKSKFKVGGASICSAKTLFKVGALAAVAACTVTQSNAAPIFQDTFPYTSGSDLNGQGPWTTNGGYSPANLFVVGGPKTYTDSASNSESSAGSITGGGGYFSPAYANATFAAPSTGNVFVSFLAADFSSSGFIVLNSAAGGLQIERDSNGGWDGYAKNTSDNFHFTTATQSAAAQSLIVLDLDYSVAGKFSLSYALDPTLTGTPTFTNLISGDTLKAGSAGLSGISVRSPGGGTVNLSEVTVSTSVGDAVNFAAAAPEPSTWALMFGGLLGLFGIKRFLGRRSDLI